MRRPSPARAIPDSLLSERDGSQDRVCGGLVLLTVSVSARVVSSVADSVAAPSSNMATTAESRRSGQRPEFAIAHLL